MCPSLPRPLQIYCVSFSSSQESKLYSLIYLKLFSYIDPNGKKISVKYTAGKEGFRILEADHLPKAPQPVAPLPAPVHQSAYQPQTAYQPQQSAYQPQTHYQPRSYQPQYNYRSQQQEDDGQYKPEVYERPQQQVKR